MKIKTRGSWMKSLKWFVTILALAFSSAYVAGSMNFLPLDVKKNSSTKDFQWADLLSKTLEQTQKKSGGDNLSLSDLVDIALNNNPTLRQAWSTSKASYYDKLTSDGTYFPSVTIANTGTRQKFPETTYTIGRVQSTSQAYYQNSYRPSVAVNYLVWDFGSRSGSVEAAYQTMVSQDWTYKWTIQGVLKDVHNPQSYHILSEWNNEEDFNTFITSEKFRNVTNWGKEQILSSRPSHQVYKESTPIGS